VREFSYTAPDSRCWLAWERERVEEVLSLRRIYIDMIVTLRIRVGWALPFQAMRIYVYILIYCVCRERNRRRRAVITIIGVVYIEWTAAFLNMTL
jgi:hypothetical protein